VSASPSSLQYFVGMAFGSDDLTPYTAQYAWNSNQMAHAMMGFCLAVCWLTFVISLHPGRHRVAERTVDPPPTRRGRLTRWLRELPMDLYVVLLFATIPAKECADIILDRGMFAGSPVQPNQSSLLFDSVTDTSFWWAGMFLAAAVLALFTKEERGLRFVVPVLGLVGCATFWVYVSGGVWQNQKQTFDVSGMPFNFTRLAVLSGRNEIHFADNSPVKWPELESFREKIVQAPLAGRPPQKHFVIYGGTPAQRSKLAVAMGCEFAFKLRENRKYSDDRESLRVMYVSAVASLERPEALIAGDIDLIECVIVDDLDVGIKLPSRVDDDQLYRFYLNSADLPAPAPRTTAPSAQAAPPSKERRPARGNITIPLEDLKKLNASKGKPLDLGEGSASKKTVELSKAEFEKLAPPSKPPDRNAALNEAKEELEGRVTVLKSFGRKTKLPGDKKPEDGGISTIWVLAGHPGTKDSTHAAWLIRRDEWVKEIADILGVDRGVLQIVELVETPNGADR
jgi:hypothetical protein